MKEVATKDDFVNELKNAGSKLVVVDFHATWCGPCKHIAPKLEEFSKTYGDCVFFKVDVDENEQTAQDEEISAMPTFRLYKNGKKIDEVVGADAAKLEAAIQKHK